jgi:septal ring factor EnvC (AmiA/AmiB activator)
MAKAGNRDAVVALHEAAAELETLRHHRRSSQATVEELRGQLRGMEEKLNNAAVVAARSQQQRDELIDVLQCYMSFVQSLCATSQVYFNTMRTYRTCCPHTAPPELC